MELRIFDITLMPIGIVDETQSVIWKSTYWQEGDYGDVKILVPFTTNNSKLLIKGNLITKHDRRAEYVDRTGQHWRRCIQITYRHIIKDENGAEQIEIQGCLLKKWLKKRIIKNAIITRATNQNIINQIIRENLGDHAEEVRAFPNFIMLPQEDLGGEILNYTSPEYINCEFEVHDRAVAEKIGYDILVNEQGRQFGFWLYKGKDFTAGNKQKNPPCIFSRDFDNVTEQEFEESIEHMGNIIYVISTNADDGNEIKYIVEAGDIDSKGLDRDEIYIEASDISRKEKQTDGQEILIPVEQYMELLVDRGIVELESYGETMNFTSAINTSSNIKYMQDFYIGDVVTCIEKRWGIRIDVRIISVSEIYQNGKVSLEITFGDNLPTLMQKLRKKG